MLDLTKVVFLHGHMPAFTVHGDELCRTFIHARGKWMILNLICEGEGETRKHVEVNNDEIAETYCNIEKNPVEFDKLFPDDSCDDGRTIQV